MLFQLDSILNSTRPVQNLYFCLDEYFKWFLFFCFTVQNYNNAVVNVVSTGEYFSVEKQYVVNELFWLLYLYPRSSSLTL